jgi:PAS domain S-box-containing protein
MEKLPITVLYVEDETVVLFSVTEMLKRRVENVLSAIDGEEGFELFKKHTPDVVITDINMPRMNGLQMARKIKQHNPDIHIYLLSAYPQPDYLLEAIDVGVKGFLKKPLDKEKLFAILREISEPTLLKEMISRGKLDREIVESALQESEKKYQTIFKNLNKAIFVFELSEDNIPGRIVEVNDMAVRYLGYSKEELLNMTPHDFINKDFHKTYLHLLDELKEKHHLTFESEDITKDGKIIPVEVSTHLMTQKDKTFVIAIVRDISKSKKYEEELLLHSYVLRNLHDSVIITDLNGNITYVNNSVVNTLHYTKEQLIGKNISILGEDKDIVSQNEIIENTLNKGHWHGLVVNFTSEGEKIYYDSHTWVMHDRNKEPIALVGISHDITSEKAKEEKLKESERKFRTLAENIPGTVYIYEMCKDGKNRIMHYLGPGFREMIGEKFSKEINYDATTFFDYVHPDDYEGLQVAAEKALKNNEPLSYEYRMKSTEGNIIWIRSICRGMILKNGNTLWQGVLINVSERKEAERQLKNNEAFSNALFEYNPVETIVVDKTGKIVRYNNSIEENRSRVPEIGDVMYKDFAAKHNIEMYNTLMSCIKNNKRKVFPDTVYRKGEKSEKHLHITIAPFPEGAIITARDISRQVRAEKLLKKEIEQKELLIKEINHRVKNNFALVSSLLAIQQQNIEDKKVQDIFEEAQNRIQSIALVHKLLYNSENLAHIDFSTYITSLVRQLRGGFENKTGQITFDLDIQEVALNIAKAIPCGLIINELITNAFKHGLKDKETGTISVKMHSLDSNQVEFVVSNDGIPFPQDIDFRKTQTLGLQLVTSLVKQIDGNIELDKRKGTKFIITFNI